MITQYPTLLLNLKRMDEYKKNSEYDQRIPQSHTADQPTAPLGRATRHHEDKQS